MMLLPQEKGTLVVEEGFLVLSGEKSEARGHSGDTMSSAESPELLWLSPCVCCLFL